MTPSNHANLGCELPVEVGVFSDVEIIDAVNCLAAKKAAGADEIPPELWKLLSSEIESMTGRLNF